MQYCAFVSYASSDTEIVENLRGHLSENGVTAWVYSLDRCLAVDAWLEIKAKIEACDLIIFVVSKSTADAKGQKQELELALQKFEPHAGSGKIMPVLINDGASFSSLPEVLRNKNGLVLDAWTVKSVAWKIATRAFPRASEEELSRPWKYPTPGQWLVVSCLDDIVAQHFDIGDKLYFRALSPMGLMECYAPKLQDLFWIAPDHVKASSDTEEDKKLEATIPRSYTVTGMLETYQRGWQTVHGS